MAQSLYETCRDLVEAHRRQDVPKMNQILREMALFFPGSESKRYARVISDRIIEEPRDTVDRSSLTFPRL